MAVIIQCPHCRSELAIDQAPSGTEFECPVCRKNFTVETGTPDETDGNKHLQQDNLRRQLIGKIGNEAPNWGFQGKSILKIRRQFIWRGCKSADRSFGSRFFAKISQY